MSVNPNEALNHAVQKTTPECASHETNFFFATGLEFFSRGTFGASHCESESTSFIPSLEFVAPPLGHQLGQAGT